LKRDGTRAETRFRLSAKRTSPFKSAGGVSSVDYWQPGVRISGSNAGYTTFQGSVKSTGYPLHSPFSPLLPLPCVTVCHHISTGLYGATKMDTQCPGYSWTTLSLEDINAEAWFTSLWLEVRLTQAEPLTCKTVFVNKSQQKQAGRNEKLPKEAANRTGWWRVVESIKVRTRQ